MDRRNVAQINVDINVVVTTGEGSEINIVSLLIITIILQKSSDGMVDGFSICVSCALVQMMSCTDRTRLNY